MQPCKGREEKVTQRRGKKEQTEQEGPTTKGTSCTPIVQHTIQEKRENVEKNKGGQKTSCWPCVIRIEAATPAAAADILAAAATAATDGRSGGG